MTDNDCPSSDQLKAYLLGQMHVEQTDEVARHVDRCPPCEDTVAALEQQSDTLLSGLRSQERGKYASDDDYQQALAFVKNIGREASLATSNTGATAKDDAPPVGNLREYELLEKLGEGGMGAVYKARHTKLDKVVAIKILPAERMRDAGAVARFEQEMRAVGKLDHPNIVRAMDAGEVDGTHFLVMEHVRGVDLSQLIKGRGLLPISDACELIRQAAVGLDEANEHSMVHRDIKPSNLMLAQHRRKPPVVKILDLGLALLSGGHAPDAGGLTSTGQMMGTLDYMAPEQGGDSHDVDIRADIYALGASLYKLLTGKVVYHGQEHRTPVQKLTALATEPAPPIQPLREEIPDALAALVHRMLEKKPENRTATPAEVVQALAPFCEGADLYAYVSTEPVPEASDLSQSSATQPQPYGRDTTTGPPVDRPASATQEQSATTVAPVTESQRPGWRGPAAIATALGALALAAAVVVFTLKTPQGVITVKVAEQYQDQISIKVSGDDGPLVISMKNNFRIELADGKYTLEMGDGKQQFKLSRQEIIVSKGTTQVVEVTFRETVAKTADTKIKSNHDVPAVVKTTSQWTPGMKASDGAPSLADLDAAHEAGYRMLEIGEWEGVDGGITQDSSHLVACDGRGKARVINFFTQKVVQTMDGIRPPLAFSETGTHMAAPIDDDTLGVWDWKTGEQLKTHEMPSLGLMQLKLRDDGQVLLVRVDPSVKNAIQLVTSDDPQPRLFVGHNGEVDAVAISADHQFLVSHSSAGEVKTWRVADRMVLYEGEWTGNYGGQGVHVVFAENGKSFFITETVQGLARINTLNGQQQFKVNDGRISTMGISISRNARLGISLYEGRLRLFDPATGVIWKNLASAIPFMRYSIAPQFSPDGQFFVLREHQFIGSETNGKVRPPFHLRLYRLPTCERSVPLTATSGEQQGPWQRFGTDVGCVHVGRSVQGSNTTDGHFVAGGYATAIIHDIANGRETRRIDAPRVVASLISPDRKHVASFQQNPQRVFNIVNVETGKTWRSPPCLWDGAAFLANGNLFMAQNQERRLSIFNVETGRELGSLFSQIEHGPFNRIATSQDGFDVAGLTTNGFVNLWKIPREWGNERSRADAPPVLPFRIIKAHQGEAFDAAFSGDGDRVVTCGSDKKIIEWDLKTGKRLRTMEKIVGIVNRLVVDRHDRVITGEVDGVLRIRDWETGNVSFTLSGHSGHIEDLRLSGDDRYVLSSSQTFGSYSYSKAGYRFGDHTGRYWRLPPADKEPSAAAYQGEVKRISWRQYDHEKLLSAIVLPVAGQAITVHQPEKDKKGKSVLRMWDIDAEKEIRQLEGHAGPITHLTVSPSERIIAAATEERVHAWSASDGRLVYSLESRGPLAFTSDSSQLLTGGGEEPCVVWDMKTGETVREIQVGPKDGGFRSHLILPGQGSVVSQLALERIHDNVNRYVIWDWQSGETYQSFNRVRLYNLTKGFVGCSSSGDRLLVSAGNFMEFVDPGTSAVDASPPGHDANVSGGKFFDEDRFLITWGNDQTIRIWDVATRTEIYLNGEHRYGHSKWYMTPHHAADITPDREHLLSVGDDGTIRKFRLPSEVIERLKANP